MDKILLAAAYDLGALAADGGDMAQRQKDMKEVLWVFSNPISAAAADSETTHRLALFLKREIRPLGAVIKAIGEMPENSEADVRAKDEASDAARELLFTHFRYLLAPHGSAKDDDVIIEMHNNEERK